MQTTRVLIVYPGSLFGGEWAAGPRLKPELVTMTSELRRAGHEVDVLDLEVELGLPGDDEGRRQLLLKAEALLAARPADLVVVSCWSALQYSAAVAVAERVRRAHPGAVLAVAGQLVSARPEELAGEASSFDWLVTGEAETAVLALAAGVAGGERSTASHRLLEGTPLPLDADHLPDYAAYPYLGEARDEVHLMLSRGCPYNSPACLLRPGGAGWHAYPPDVALDLIGRVAALGFARVSVLDPAFGYDPAWRTVVLQGLADADRRYVALSVASRPDALTRRDLDLLYAARVRLRLDVGTLSRELLSRTGQAARPQQAAAHVLDLLAYANAKGVLTHAAFTFNQPGETRETAAETLDALERFVEEAPNSSVTIEARPWAYLPAAAPTADLDAPEQRYGTQVLYPTWWREPMESRPAAEAVVASRELADLLPGDRSYWRPRFEELRERLHAKLTAEAREGVRSHEAVGSDAYGVPHGWLVEPRWH